AICELEAGRPEEAAKHFTNALTLSPDMPTRPIAAYYLEKLGKAVPPKRSKADPTSPAVGTGTTTTIGTIPGLPGVAGTTATPASPQPTPAGEPAKAASPPSEKKPEESKATPK